MNGALDLASRLINATEFWSALLGAVAGGAIAYLIQRVALNEGRRQREQDKLERQQGIATSVIFKLMRMYSDLHSLNEHLEDAFASPQAPGVTPWQVVRPLATLPDIVNFSADELTLLLAHVTPDIVDLSMDLDVRHNSMIANMQEYIVRRGILVERITSIAGKTTTKGDVASFLSDDARVDALRPMMGEVDSIVYALRGMLPAVTSDARRALSQAHDQLQRRLKLTFKIALPPLDSSQ